MLQKQIDNPWTITNVIVIWRRKNAQKEGKPIENGDRYQKETRWQAIQMCSQYTLCKFYPIFGGFFLALVTLTFDLRINLWHGH